MYVCVSLGLGPLLLASEDMSKILTFKVGAEEKEIEIPAGGIIMICHLITRGIPTDIRMVWLLCCGVSETRLVIVFAL